MGKKVKISEPLEIPFLDIFLTVAILFLLTRLFIAGSGYFCITSFLKHKWFGDPQSFLDFFFRWDSGWYYSIVTEGYSYTPGKSSNVAFYPLYPLLVKIFSSIFGHAKEIGFIISNLGLLTGAYYLYRIVIFETENVHLGLLAIFLLLINPMSFFHSTFYTEGLFLGLTASSFYYARRNRLLLAGCIGFFATLTRMTGVFTAIPIIVQAFQLTTDFSTFRIPRRIKTWIAIFLPALGILSLYFFFYLKFGDPFVGIKTQSTWSRHFSVIDFFKSIFDFPIYFRILFFVFFVLALLCIIHSLYIKLNFSYPLYILFSVLLPLTSGSAEAFPRFMSVVFPIYLSLALLIYNRTIFKYSLYMIFIGLLSLSISLFVNGYWMT